MISIAITGNIASGKSQVENILRKMGYVVFDADKIAHEMLNIYKNDITELFQGYDIFENGNIARKKLGKLVFNNIESRKKLEHVIHPKVKEKIEEIFSEYKNETYVFISVPLLFETHMENLFDKVLFVYCSDNIRLEHLKTRNNIDDKYAKTIMETQIPQDKKLPKSDYIIKNESTLENLHQQLKQLF